MKRYLVLNVLFLFSFSNIRTDRIKSVIIVNWEVASIFNYYYIGDVLYALLL